MGTLYNKHPDVQILIVFFVTDNLKEINSEINFEHFGEEFNCWIKYVGEFESD